MILIRHVCLTNLNGTGAGSHVSRDNLVRHSFESGAQEDLSVRCPKTSSWAVKVSSVLQVRSDHTCDALITTAEHPSGRYQPSEQEIRRRRLRLMPDEIKRSHTRGILDVDINRFHRHEHLNELERNIPGDCQVKSRTSLVVPAVDDIEGGVGGSGCDETVHELRVLVEPLERGSLETGDSGVKESVTSVVSGGDQRWRG